VDGRPATEYRADAVTAMRKAFEAYFHSDEQVREYVAKASAIVDDLEVADDLREAAFAQAVQLLAQKQVTFEQVSPGGLLLGGNGSG
jgi:hypothetical protein